MSNNDTVLFAKQYMIEYIYNAINIEGIGMTFSETQTICDGMSVSGKSIDDIQAVCDLKRAYQWILSNIDAEMGIDVLKKINREIGKFTIINAGSIRHEYDEPIRVLVNNDNYYYPPLPPGEEIIDKELKSIMESDNCYGELFCYIAKSQFFTNGNKRTATLFCSMLMIKRELGTFTIPNAHKLEFYQYLTNYYENEECKKHMIKFLEKKCIFFRKRKRV